MVRDHHLVYLLGISVVYLEQNSENIFIEGKYLEGGGGGGRGEESHSIATVSISYRYFVERICDKWKVLGVLHSCFTFDIINITNLSLLVLVGNLTPSPLIWWFRFRRIDHDIKYKKHWISLSSQNLRIPFPPPDLPNSRSRGTLHLVLVTSPWRWRHLRGPMTSHFAPQVVICPVGFPGRREKHFQLFCGEGGETYYSWFEVMN